MTIFNKTCTFNVGNGALLMTKVTSLRLCLCQKNFKRILYLFLYIVTNFYFNIILLSQFFYFFERDTTFNFSG